MAGQTVEAEADKAEADAAEAEDCNWSGAGGYKVVVFSCT